MAFVRCDCGWEGPGRNFDSIAILTWNRRSSTPIQAALLKQLEVIKHLAKRGARTGDGGIYELILNELRWPGKTEKEWPQFRSKREDVGL